MLFDKKRPQSPPDALTSLATIQFAKHARLSREAHPLAPAVHELCATRFSPKNAEQADHSSATG
ncbi:hypothetical protein MB901379_02472 [Mycobacterium basiliense]|uniref:Uncharacterized protein n=1 Tax=Mycobacterium basiliense TaxID=2094119 RepID=A0A3S4CBY2_9MYCO|nr:hypothetical protein MB901379_02472 [Mycobacterium basiliense]